MEVFPQGWKEVLSKVREATEGGRRERQRTDRWTDTHRQIDTHTQERQQESKR